MHNFKKLKIWNESMELVSESYKITRSFPKFETYGLMSQMNRCAVSIPSNISEGTSKSSNKHFANYLEHSLGSAFEWETQQNVAFNESYISEGKFKELEDKTNTKNDFEFQIWTLVVLILGSKNLKIYKKLWKQQKKNY